jgi:hypothetical protein
MSQLSESVPIKQQNKFTHYSAFPQCSCFYKLHSGNNIILSGVRLSPLGTAATTALFYQPRMIDNGDCGAIGEMKIGRGNRSTRIKPAPAPLSPPQIAHDLTRPRTRAIAVRSQQLTA